MSIKIVEINTNEEIKILNSIERKKESTPFNDEQIDFIFKYPKIFSKYLKPTYPNGSINHQFLKGFKVKAYDATVHTDEYEIIGFYYCDKKKNLSFAVKPIKGSKNITRWWFYKSEDLNIPFIINKNIVFSNEKANKCYLSANYSYLYKLVNQNNLNGENNNEN